MAAVGVGISFGVAVAASEVVVGSSLGIVAVAGRPNGLLERCGSDVAGIAAVARMVLVIARVVGVRWLTAIGRGWAHPQNHEEITIIESQRRTDHVSSISDGEHSNMCSVIIPWP
jgi:hypothetical protein